MTTTDRALEMEVSYRQNSVNFSNILYAFSHLFFTDTERNHDRSFDSRPNIVPVDTVGINVDSSANMLRISLFNSLASSTFVTLTLVLSRIVILFRHH